MNIIQLIFSIIQNLFTPKLPEVPEIPVPGPEIPENIDIRSPHDLVYRVPQEMKSITIQIQESNGRVITEHNVTPSGYFLAIKPGQKIRVRVNT